MATMKIKKGDMVKVIAGKDKDKEGKVIAVNTKNNTVLVEGINMVTKHAKPSMANQQGGKAGRAVGENHFLVYDNRMFAKHVFYYI